MHVNSMCSTWIRMESEECLSVLLLLLVDEGIHFFRPFHRFRWRRSYQRNVFESIRSCCRSYFRFYSWVRNDHRLYWNNVVNVFWVDSRRISLTRQTFNNYLIWILNTKCTKNHGVFFVEKSLKSLMMLYCWCLWGTCPLALSHYNPRLGVYTPLL